VKQISSQKRSRSHSGAPASKKRSVAKVQRPLRKRILLHPFSVMVLLCAGVLMAGMTFKSTAVSYDVTATVPAPIPNTPAVITAPSNQEHVPNAVIDVSGTCPPQSYVKLYREGNFSGVSTCTASAFHIQTSLSPGANQLTARVFSVTDQEGPAATPVNVWYDQTSLPPQVPPSVPAQLTVQTVDTSSSPSGAYASSNPTVTGFAPPYADIELTFHSDPVVCHTRADGNGWWSCTLDRTLPVGVHRVDIVAQTSDGRRLLYPTFNITVTASVQPLNKRAPNLNLPQVQVEYTYQAHRSGQSFFWDMSLISGKAPYRLEVDWGDGSQTTYERHDHSLFTISHIYHTTFGRDYVIRLKSIDATGNSSVMQLAAVVKGLGSGIIATASTGWRAQLAGFVDNFKQWVWLIWPVYIVVVLMVLSFWLGEREVYERIVRRRQQLARHAAGKGRR
jgi:hypothetical protein